MRLNWFRGSKSTNRSGSGAESSVGSQDSRQGLLSRPAGAEAPASPQPGGISTPKSSSPFDGRLLDGPPHPIHQDKSVPRSVGPNGIMIHGPYNPRPLALNDPSIGLYKAPIPVGPNYYAKMQGKDDRYPQGISPNYPGKLTYSFGENGQFGPPKVVTGPSLLPKEHLVPGPVDYNAIADRTLTPDSRLPGAAHPDTGTSKGRYYAGGFKPGPQGYPSLPESRTPENPYGLNAPDTSRLDPKAILDAGNRAGDQFMRDQAPQGYTLGPCASGAGPSAHGPSSADSLRDSLDDTYRPVT